ncbi:hypothetical protein LTR10_011197 [Elasticomyces elasticus]|nr:hypothetical protein LTR10_011197 [Elasticomyces elasticus]KAK4966382.1 hypothetical protein LTR42_011545 [Elasticomyces elasticus]
MAQAPSDKLFDIIEQWELDTRTRAFGSLNIGIFRTICRCDWFAHRHSMAKKSGKLTAASSSQTKGYKTKSNKTPAKIERMLARMQISSDSRTILKSNIPASNNPIIATLKHAAAKALQLHYFHRMSINVDSPIEVTKSTRLATLPREMRDHIYSFVDVVGVNIADRRQHWSGRYNPSLAKVSQSMAAEFWEHYYKNTTFIFDTRIGLLDNMAGYPVYKQEARKLVKIWNSWMATLDTADVGRVRHLMFYGKKDIVRLELSTKPLKVTCSVKSKYGDELDPTCKLVEDIEKMQRGFDRNIAALNMRQTRFTSYDLGRMCQAVFDARAPHTLHHNITLTHKFRNTNISYSDSTTNMTIPHQHQQRQLTCSQVPSGPNRTAAPKPQVELKEDSQKMWTDDEWPSLPIASKIVAENQASEPLALPTSQGESKQDSAEQKRELNNCYNLIIISTIAAEKTLLKSTAPVSKGTQSASKVRKPIKRSRGLMDLPGEIRNHIYSFVRSAAINIEDRRQTWIQSPLAWVDPRITIEYRDFYFSCRTFWIDVRVKTAGWARRIQTWHAWLERLPERDASALSRLMIYGDFGPERIEISRNPARVVLSRKKGDTWYERGGDDVAQLAVNAIAQSCGGHFSKHEIMRIGEEVLWEIPVWDPYGPLN